MGWSMGGAIVLQLLDRSPLSALVSRVVLDAPVIDWGDVLAHLARHCKEWNTDPERWERLVGDFAAD